MLRGILLCASFCGSWENLVGFQHQYLGVPARYLPYSELDLVVGPAAVPVWTLDDDKISFSLGLMYHDRTLKLAERRNRCRVHF
jgi:hypothetical protein